MAAIFPDKDMKKLLTDTYDNKDIVAMVTCTQHQCCKAAVTVSS